MSFEAMCRGGPLNGEKLLSRFPKGVLLVDRPSNRCWIYERRGDLFVVRNEEPMPILTEGPKNRRRAAEESNYDVVAAPWVVTQ